MLCQQLLKRSSIKLFSKKFCAGLIFSHQKSLSTTSVVLQQQAAPDLSILSHLTDYVNRQLFLYTPESPKEKPLTTVVLLNDCQSVDDVLNLIENMHRSNMLWKDELLLYHNSIVSFTNAITDMAEKEQTIKHILNNKNFHTLLRSTATASIQMLTDHLAQFLYCAENLMIPNDSFIIENTIEVMKKRINDFFPKDVAVCHAALKNYKFATPEMQSLQKGLIMHLENMAEDEEFFAISASDVHLSVVSILMKYFGQNPSRNLKEGLFAAIEESVKMRKRERIEFDLEFAVTALVALLNLRYKKKKLFDKSMDMVLSNSDSLTQEQKLLLQETVKNREIFPFFGEKAEIFEHAVLNSHKQMITD